MKKEVNKESEKQDQVGKVHELPGNPERREALEKLVKYTPPAMITLLANDSAWAQLSGGPPGLP